VVVAALLLMMVRTRTARAHVIRLGLLAYVTYSYAIYLIGIPINQMFLVYVVLVSLSGAALMDGLVRLRPEGWPRTSHRRLERGTGWMLVVVSVLFAGLWLVAVVPFALGGSPPNPEGPGGVAYPVFVLDLVVVLMTAIIVVRFGLLAFVIMSFMLPVLDHTPLTFDPTIWYSGQCGWRSPSAPGWRCLASRPPWQGGRCSQRRALATSRLMRGTLRFFVGTAFACR